MLTLPDALRHELKEPMGPIETDAAVLLESASRPLIAVGDVVTYHLLQADFQPDVAVVDGKTKRSAVDDEIRRVVTDGVSLEASSPPAVLTEDVIRTLTTALESPEPTTILVDGEEDLVALPAVVVAPDGATVVYGQPNEGMVLVEVDEAVREDVRALLERFEGDHERFWRLLSSEQEQEQEQE